MKKGIISLFIILVLLINIDFASAQLQPYFSVNKGWNGLVVGVEVINQKTQKIISPTSYNYEWLLPILSVETIRSKGNLLFLKLEKIFPTLPINLKIKKPFTKEMHSLESKIDLPPPVVKIVRKHKGFILPLSTFLSQKDFVTVTLNNFSAENIQFFWELDGVFVSNEKEVPVNILPAKSGFLKVQVFGSFPRESAVDFKYIKIE